MPMRIGLLPVAGKPVHEGHWRLLCLAAEENDIVKVFASKGDRGIVKGAAMMKVWRELLIPVAPSNTCVIFASAPVKNVYDELRSVESSGSRDTCTIYSDEVDILKYTDASVRRHAPIMLSEGRINRRGVSRQDTVDISGTAMRRYLAEGLTKEFALGLPQPVKHRAHEIMKLLLRADQ